MVSVEVPDLGAGGDQPDAAGAPLGSRRHATLMLAVAAAVMLISGIAMVLHGRSSASGPPQPAADAARPLPAPHKADAEPEAKSIYALSMPPSRPVRIAIPRLGVDADLMALGALADGTLDVPTPAQARRAAWYDRGPMPGEAGSSVITGHVGSREIPAGRAAFFFLGNARPGDKLQVLRADHTVAEFTVDSAQVFAKSAFPTDKVYGQIDYAGLRLITCGGSYSKATGYTGNVVVFAHLSATSGPPPPPPVYDNGPVPGVLSAEERPKVPAHPSSKRTDLR